MTKSIIENSEKIKTLTRNCRHNYVEQGSFLICSVCGKKKLKLKNSDKHGLLVGETSDGRRYSVRTDRRRYFFPDEWNDFIKNVKDKDKRFLYITLLHTGARIMEALNLKYKNIDIDRGAITLEVTKQRKAKKDFQVLGKSRNFFVAENYIKEYKSFIRGRTIDPEAYIFLNNEALPDNYDELDNRKKKKYFSNKAYLAYVAMRKALEDAGIKDWYNFSLHNIRKTYGMWMRTFNNDFGDLCYRMGHDMNTFMSHYGSSLIFTDEERRKIQDIMGNVR